MFPTNNDSEENCTREGGTYFNNVCATPRGPAQPDSKPDRIVVMFPSLPVDGRSAYTIRIASYNSNSKFAVNQSRGQKIDSNTMQFEIEVCNSSNRCVTWPPNVAMRMIFKVFRFGNKEDATMSQLRWGEYYTFRWHGSIHRNGPQGAHIVSENSARSSRVTIGQGHEKFVCLNGVENLITDNADGSTYANLRAIANTYRDCGALTFGKRGKKCSLTNGEITNKGNTLDEIQRKEAQSAKPNSRLICDPFQQLPNGSSCHFFENKVHRKTGLRRGYMSSNKCMLSHDEKGCLRCPGIVLKRKNIALKSGDDKYGHWWIEIDAKTQNNTCPMGANAIGESYGWWPSQHVNIIDTLTSVPGTLNGNDSVFKEKSELNENQDPKHCKTAEETLKVVIKPNRTCAEAKTAIRRFVSGYHGTWSWPFGQNCHSFQQSLMQSARLYQEGTCRP